MANPTPGARAYGAWRAHQQSAWLHERPLPWDQLDVSTQAAWEAAARAVRESHTALCPVCAAELAGLSAQEDTPHA